MATTADIDKGVTALASARLALALATENRNKKVVLRDIAAAELTAATSAMVAARDAMTTAKTNLLALLSQAET